MPRGRTGIIPLVLLCLLSGACALKSSSGEGLPASGPDPRTAIALSVLSESIFVVDPSTGERAEVAADLLDYQSGYAVWSPDHRRLAYANHGVFVMDFVAHEQRVAARGGGLSMPAWSPDGTRMVFGDGTSLWITPSGQPRPARIRLPATIAPVGMSWGAGSDIVFEGLRRDCASSYLCPSTDQSDVWVVHADGSRLRQVTHIGHVDHPKWSPDGSDILFIRRFPGEPRHRELWVVGSDGSEARPLGPAKDVVAADWSPDGTHVAMVRLGPRPTTLQLWVADSAGAGGHRLGQPVHGSEATVDW